MNISLTKFCKDYALSKSTVYRRCQELGIETTRGLSTEDCARLLHEFDLVTVQTGEESEQPVVRVEMGNHQLVLSAPDLPQTYSLGALRTGESVQFEDPLAIAAQFLVIADQVQAAMESDIQQREQKLAATRQAKDTIAAKAQELKLEQRLYKERTHLIDTAQTHETQGLQQSLTTLQSLGKPPADA